MKPKICIGMFLYNEEKYLVQAMESLLAQTYRDFRLIVLNDCSTDSTEAIVQHYARMDPRIEYVKNPHQMGYANNYRITFDRAGDNADYFAWAAGHDIHAPRWLEAMVQALEADPEVVVAYAQTVPIDAGGAPLPQRAPTFDTTGLPFWSRVRKIGTAGEGFGNMVYGLFRVSALRKAGIMRPTLLLDRLLLSELTIHGTIKHVAEPLWLRRYPKPAALTRFDAARQRTVAFPHGQAPWYTHLPWWLVHAAMLIWHVTLFPTESSLSRRLGGLYLAWLVFRSRAAVEWIQEPCVWAKGQFWAWGAWCSGQVVRWCNWAGRRLRSGPRRFRAAVGARTPAPLVQVYRWMKLSFAGRSEGEAGEDSVASASVSRPVSRTTNEEQP